MKINPNELRYAPIRSFELCKYGTKINIRYKTIKQWAKERNEMYLAFAGINHKN